MVSPRGAAKLGTLAEELIWGAGMASNGRPAIFGVSELGMLPTSGKVVGILLADEKDAVGLGVVNEAV